MAYQNVGTPRFFIDHGLWLYTLGIYQPPNDHIPIIQLNPASITTTDTYVVIPRKAPINYIAFLGTGSSSTGYHAEWNGLPDGSGDIGTTAPGFTEIVNMSGFDDTPEQYDGFSMATFTDDPSGPYLKAVWDTSIGIGAISIGSTYTMPHSPDLSLTLTRDYSGIKTIETKGGASLSNAFYNGSPSWGNAGAWELYSGTPTNQALSRSGRRVWDLSFSYLQDSDVFAPTESLISAIFDKDGYDSMWYNDPNHAYGDLWRSENRFLAHDDFYSQVIHKTNGGQLPFIFQPDKDNNNPDQFAICKLDMKSFKFSQTAHKLYNVKLKIREVW